MPTKSKNKVKVEIKADMRVALNIEHKSNDGMISAITLNSIIEEISEDGSLIIQMPIHQGYHYPLPRDNPILMHFFVDSDMYALLVKFEERIQREQLIYAKLRRHSEIKPHQRRDCYRFPYSLPITIERFWQNECVIYPERQPTQGQLINFSDGGMLFSTNENFEKNEKITITFDMGKVEIIEGMALRTQSIDNGKHQFMVAVQFRFKDKDKAQKRRFYKYIVDKQMEERRRLTQNIKQLHPLGKKHDKDD